MMWRDLETCWSIKPSFGRRLGQLVDMYRSTFGWWVVQTSCAKTLMGKVYFGDVNSLDKGKDFVVRGQSWERYADL